MADHFNELGRVLAEYGIAVDRTFLHGLLTGYATIPAPDSEKLFSAIAGEQQLAELVREKVFGSIDRISQELSTHTFRARLEVHSHADANHWLDGYIRAVGIHEKDWQELNESHPEAAVNLVMLHSMNSPNLRHELNPNLPGPKELKEHPELVTNLVTNIYDHFRLDTDDDFGQPPDDILPWPEISGDELSAMDETSLMSVVTSSDDALPIEIFMECVSRKDAMIPLLRRHLENDTRWSPETDDGNWWGLLHAVFMLGRIPGEASAQLLMQAFRRITADDDNDLSDWVGPYWPALCRDKMVYMTDPFQQIAENPKLGWYARGLAIDCILAEAAEQGTAKREKAIDWVAAMCGDTAEDLDFRVISGHDLLDLPRERHRPVMEALVDLQEPRLWFGNAYTREDIQRSFDSGDNPEWRRFDNPWQFYEPDEIQRRQDRWFRESQDLDSDTYSAFERVQGRPFVREETKIGRNEPCPCGSGKKYKKCCLKTH